MKIKSSDYFVLFPRANFLGSSWRFATERENNTNTRCQSWQDGNSVARRRPYRWYFHQWCVNSYFTVWRATWERWLRTAGGVFQSMAGFKPGGQLPAIVSFVQAEYHPERYTETVSHFARSIVRPKAGTFQGARFPRIGTLESSQFNGAVFSARPGQPE
jgi:hypothetical protein